MERDRIDEELSLNLSSTQKRIVGANPILSFKSCSKCRDIRLTIRKRITVTPYYYVVCCGCGKIGTFENSREEAINSWNKKNP